MALRRCMRSVDGTIPVSALLYDDEELFASQGDVGVYDGPQKSSDHQAGVVHVTTHRLFYIDQRNALSRSFAMELSLVTQTEYYAGLFKSSPKITLHLSPASSHSSSGNNEYVDDSFRSWECEVCGNRNPPGLSPTAEKICALCGVPQSAIPNPIDSAPTSTSHSHLSSSLPSTSHPSTISLSVYSPRPTTTESVVDPEGNIPCPACTFNNHPSLSECEMCGTRLPPPRRAMKSAPTSRPTSPDTSDEDEPRVRAIKLSFRKGGDKPFYAVLKRSLKSKAWESGKQGKSGIHTPTNPDAGRSGIHGILTGVETSAQSQETVMQDAFQDLEALMIKARDMVRLAADLNERLTALSATTTAPSGLSDTTSATLVPSTEPEEATFIRTSLSQLGLQMANAPVTLDMIKDEREWIAQLARELAGVLQGDGRHAVGMMKARVIIALDEVWGGWNRARGVALIPPSTFLLVLPHLPSYTSPQINTRTFPSGLSVLHTPPYSHTSFSARLSGLLPNTTTEIAHEEGLTVGLAAEMIAAVEVDGLVCRDDPGFAAIGGGGSGAGVQIVWWTNLFLDYVWDGHEAVTDDIA